MNFQNKHITTKYSSTLSSKATLYSLSIKSKLSNVRDNKDN